MHEEERSFEETAAWLLRREAPGARDLDEFAAAAERVCRRLRVVLHDVIGDQGCAAILVRARHLAEDEHPWLQALRPYAGGDCLQGLPEALAGQSLEEARRRLVDLFARTLQELSSLISPDIVLGQIEVAWPEMPRPISRGHQT